MDINKPIGMFNHNMMRGWPVLTAIAYAERTCTAIWCYGCR